MKVLKNNGVEYANATISVAPGFVVAVEDSMADYLLETFGSWFSVVDDPAIVARATALGVNTAFDLEAKKVEEAAQEAPVETVEETPAEETPVVTTEETPATTTEEPAATTETTEPAKTEGSDDTSGAAKDNGSESGESAPKTEAPKRSSRMS